LTDHYAEAERLVEPRKFQSGGHTITNHPTELEISKAQVRATLALVDEVRRLNDGRDAFHETMRVFFERLTKDDDEGVGFASGPPSSATDGREGGDLQ